ncbi:RNB domain-containing ribonuclease [Streptomyces sp. CB01881]|uniref:RNB domain-containing ribonuclease n=1 Tax=Streptomyces sp. CB01881 TaxID=2078691 RepID=UPI000CDC4C47|nr:RNB domain-containing ribonuclease [Streptomyces sp. CB01881]AUY51997.1 ribonuclease II [Streptomyces sp. CB01881]TYC71427.1 RNB domain-containing ribonuclease [Streptomyces sp. CB01881]
MPRRKLRVKAADSARINAELTELRARLEIHTEWPDPVLAEAEEAARTPRLPEYDATGLPLLTVDPPGSRDLDQAMHLAHRPGGGYRVHYAIADVAAFVRPGGLIDAEARRRVQTLYFPDHRVPLHPARLSEDAASLLPGETRPALLWQLDLDADGAVVLADLRRALVRSHRRLDYAAVQRAVDAGGADEQPALLATVGRLREEQERARGGISLPVPEQEIEETLHGYVLGYRAPAPADGWNAQISLLTGMAAAELMLDAGVGLLRTLPAAPPEAYQRLRRTARALDVDWPDGLPYPELVRSLDPDVPLNAAFLNECTGLLRGAGYHAFDTAQGLPVPADPAHAALAAPYAHCTAPLRRLGDRFAQEVCAAVAAGESVPDWAREALPAVPSLMAGGDRRSAEVERACVDLVEAELLAGREGEDFPALVIDVDEQRPARGTVQLREPAVRARCERPDDASGAGRGLPLGGEVLARLTVADPATRTVRFTAV